MKKPRKITERHIKHWEGVLKQLRNMKLMNEINYFSTRNKIAKLKPKFTLEDLK